VAAMDPFASLLPRRMRGRFRMERLGYEGALEAVKMPASRGGVSFDPGVAEKLVDDLCRIKALRVGERKEAQDSEEQVVLGPTLSRCSCR